MTTEELLEALGELDERLLLPAAETKRRRPKGRTALLAAALCLLLLSTAAVAVSGNLSGALHWFGKHWERSSTENMSEGQEEILHAMTQELGLVAEDAGVTIVAESVTAGVQSATVLFRVQLPEGSGNMARDLGCAETDIVMTPGPGQSEGESSWGAGFPDCEYDEAEGCYWMPMVLDASEPLDGSVWSVTLRDIKAYFGLCVLACYEGEWCFEIPISVSEAAMAETIYIANAEVACEREGEPGTAVIEGLEITPDGLSFCHSEGLDTTFSIHVELADGTRIKTDSGVGRVYQGEGYTEKIAEGVERQYLDGVTCIENRSWYVPIDLEDVVCIRFWDSVIELR